MGGKYRAFDPKAQVSGYPMRALIRCIRHEQIRPFLEMHGLTDINPEEWYPVQKWLDVLSSLAEEHPVQGMFDFLAVGLKVSRTALFPSEWKYLPFQEIVAAADENYAATQHRGGDVGEIINESVGTRHVKKITRTPYPDDFWFAVFYGFARRYLPPRTPIVVYYDEDEPRRDMGGERTIIHIKWE